ncbi:MAG: SufE family protein [Methylobacteriaceae bacterium]|nr:SufE family protein [Methylobacteriaceae bacterium]
MSRPALPPIDEIVANFQMLEGDEQFEYLIELGRALPPMPPELHTDDRLVPGCQSRVWLDLAVDGQGPAARIDIAADSDAHITKGLVAFLVALHSGRPAGEIVRTDALGIFRSLGLGGQVTSKRANGLRSMIERIRERAEAIAAA